MWGKIAGIILRNRIFLLAITLLLTGFFGYFVFNDLQLDTRYGVLLPDSHPAQQKYKMFTKTFGEDGSTLVIAISSKQLYTEKKFTAWKNLGEQINRISGVEGVLSEPRLIYLENDKEKRKFVAHSVFFNPKTNEERSIPEIKTLIKQNPFFNGLIYDDSSEISLMLVDINNSFLEDKTKSKVVLDIERLTEKYKPVLGKIYYSGLPHIRVTLAKRILNEMYLFLGLSLLASIFLIFYLFKSVRLLILCCFILFVSIIWALGMTALFGYPLTAMMALIPPLLVIIGIPHIVYIITCYHQEYVKSENRIKALMVTTKYIGPVTLLMNLTTAVGFITFTSSERVTEFGIISSINVMVLFVLTLYLVPIFLSFFGDPKPKHMGHLSKKSSFTFVNVIIAIVTKRRKLVYFIALLLTIIGVWGATKIIVTGNVISDVSKSDPISKDLKHLEKSFGGSIPFEILVELADSKDVMGKELMNNIEQVQLFLRKDTLFSKSFSNVDLIKFANMAYHNGNPAYFKIPRTKLELAALKQYYEASYNDFATISNDRFSINELQSKGRKPLRIRMQIKDIGSFDLLKKIDRLELQVDSLLNPNDKLWRNYYKNLTHGKAEYFDSLMEYSPIKNGLVDHLVAKDTSIQSQLLESDSLLYTFKQDKQVLSRLDTIIAQQRNHFYFSGTAVLVAEATKYLVEHLWEGLLFTLILITLLIVVLFRSVSIYFATIIPNLIPLIITSGIMGFFGIPLKPSTIMIFGIALGITVNDTILLLGKLKQKIKENPNMSRVDALMQALEESAMAMAYTSVILIFGFIMFTFSNFLGTQALGLLISITLVIGMFTNLILLPSLMISFNRRINYKNLIDAEIFNNEEEENQTTN
jgi:predicted RND superfamily exporter protein